MALQQDLTTYIALFHYRDNAASAIRDLEKIGFTADALTVIGGGNGSSYSDAKGSFGEGYSYGTHEGIAAIGVPEKDRSHLEEGLAQGGTILVLKGSEEKAAEIETIFHSHATEKIDETEKDRAAYVAPVPVARQQALESDATSIPVVQEELIVGKRQVERGGLRVFRRMVEQPVSEAVTLHEEHVVVGRRAVDRAVTEADLRAGDQSLELRGTAEEAVVSKSARVVEEIRLGKEATEHTETIRDSVRHTEVDVEELGTEVPNTTKQF